MTATVIVHVGCVPRAAQAPLQPTNELSAPTAAVSVTTCPTLKVCTHVAPQLMPAGALEVTVPAPSPSRSTEITRGVAEKVALTCRSWVIATVQEPVPAHAPAQPTKK